MTNSAPVGKPLGKVDVFCTNFFIECLKGDNIQCADFDSMVYSPVARTYVGIEIHRVMPTHPKTPWDHNPNDFWDKCKFKYWRLFHIMRSFNPPGVFFDVFVGDDESPYWDQVLVYKIQRVYADGVEFSDTRKWTREQFSNWYRKINRGANLYTPKTWDEWQRAEKLPPTPAPWVKQDVAGR